MSKTAIKNYGPLAAVTVLTLLGLILRSHTIGMRSLWMDEIRQVTAYFSENILIAMHKAASQQQPPLDNIIGYLLMLLFPFSETVVRLPALIFGTLTIPLAYLVVKRYLNSLTAILCAVLVAVSPFLIKYSQEARPYSIYFFFLLLALWSLHQVIESPSRANWRIFFWSIFTFLMSRGMAPVSQVAAIFIAVLIAIPARELHKSLFKVLCKVALVFLPFFAYITVKSKKYLTVNAAGANPRFETWYQPIQTLYTKTYPMVYDHMYAPLLTLCVLGLIWSFVERKKNRWAWWLAVFTFIEPILHMYIFHFSVRLDMHGPSVKYFFYTQYFIFALSAYTAVQVATLLAKFTHHFVRYAAALPFFYFALFYAGKLPGYYQGDPKTDYREAGRYLQSIYQPGSDLVLYESFNEFGDWVPLFFGDGLYVNKTIEQYDYLGVVKKAKNTRETIGRVILFYHGNLSQPAAPGWVHKSFYGLTILHREGVAQARTAELQLLLEQMSKLYAQNSSRVRVLLSLANLLCQSQPIQATEFLRQARAINSGVDLEGECYAEQVTE